MIPSSVAEPVELGNVHLVIVKGLLSPDQVSMQQE